MNAADISAYVADICEELTRMAANVRLPFLAYLLTMAKEEAQRLRQVPGSE